MKIKYMFIMVFYLILFGCAQQQISNISNIIPVQEQVKEKSDAQKFMEMRALGNQVTSNQNFDIFLDVLPDYFLKEASRVYLARIDDLPIGLAYSGLDNGIWLLKQV